MKISSCTCIFFLCFVFLLSSHRKMDENLESWRIIWPDDGTNPAVQSDTEWGREKDSLSAVSMENFFFFSSAVSEWAPCPWNQTSFFLTRVLSRLACVSARTNSCVSTQPSNASVMHADRQVTNSSWLSVLWADPFSIKKKVLFFVL